jgi:hypothetical protein
MRINYEDSEVVARQNIAPNAGCDIDGIFYDMRNAVHLLKEQADRIEELEAKVRELEEYKAMYEGQASENFQMYVDANEARIDAEAKLASVIAAYRIEAMRRDGYSHEAFDQHIAKLKGEDRG